MAVTSRYILVILLIYFYAFDLTSGPGPDKGIKEEDETFLKKTKDHRQKLDKHYKEQLEVRKIYFPKDPSYNVFEESPELDYRLRNMLFTRDNKQEWKEILVYPNLQVVYAGNSVSVLCISSGSKTWTREGKKLSPEYLSPTNDLFISNAFEMHSGIYTCIGLNSNNRTFKEDAIILVGDELYSYIEPQSYEGSVGDSIKFSCSQGKNVYWFHEDFKNHAVKGFLDSETDDGYWFHNDYTNHPKSYPISSGRSLTVENMQSHDRGSYFCYGQYLNKPRHFLSQAALQIYDQSRVDPVEKAAKEGERVEFFCQSKKAEWYKKGNDFVMSMEDKLIFRSVVMHDKGIYICKGQYDDSDETFVAFVQLTVMPKYPWKNFLKKTFKRPASKETQANDAGSAEKECAFDSTSGKGLDKETKKKKKTFLEKTKDYRKKYDAQLSPPPRLTRSQSAIHVASSTYMHAASKQSLRKQSLHKQYGVPLADLVARDRVKIPRVVQSCVEHLEVNGLEVMGIFRIAPSKMTVDALKRQVDQGEDIDFEEYPDPHLSAALIKIFLKELPEPLLTFPAYSQIMTLRGLRDKAERLQMCSKVVRDLPQANYDLLKYLISFLNKVRGHEEVNKMSALNLAIIFGPNLIWSTDGAANLVGLGEINSFTMLLIENYDLIFTL